MCTCTYAGVGRADTGLSGRLRDFLLRVPRDSVSSADPRPWLHRRTIHRSLLSLPGTVYRQGSKLVGKHVSF